MLVVDSCLGFPWGRHCSRTVIEKVPGVSAHPGPACWYENTTENNFQKSDRHFKQWGERSMVANWQTLTRRRHSTLQRTAKILQNLRNVTAFFVALGSVSLYMVGRIDPEMSKNIWLANLKTVMARAGCRSACLTTCPVMRSSSSW